MSESRHEPPKVADLDPEELLELAYDELHRMAAAFMRRERQEHTLQATALVNEAYVKLTDRKAVAWSDKQHFVAVAAKAMRRILIDHARGRGREKRGGELRRVSLGAAVASDASDEIDFAELLTLDTALERLAGLDPRQAKIVELRFFGGLTVSEVAAVLAVSKRTVEEDWFHARVWLKRELARSPGT